MTQSNDLCFGPCGLCAVVYDVFNKFKGRDGRFSNDIVNDARGLLSLYNAAHLLVHGEPGLEEAISFARHLLESISQSPDSSAPFTCRFQGPTREWKHVRHYMMEYEQEESHNPVLLELAKLDFNLQQHVHVKELKSFLNGRRRGRRQRGASGGAMIYAYIGLSYVRDRVVELYTWSCIYVHEEGFALTRVIFAKLLVLSTIMDDTYDAHATIDDCRKLNIAIQRWDESAVSLLPKYLTKFFHKLLSTFKEIEDELPTIEKYRLACTTKEVRQEL
ncbi:hypothetical protein EJB05_28637, partial [Eragrostis curvula]